MSRRTVDKSLLKNIIKHTDAQNKIQEQNEMWKRWELKKRSRKESRSPDIDHQIRGYMRSDKEVSQSIKAESLKWNRLLMDYEENCKDRWGHSGYKELYPEEFSNQDSNLSDLESSTNSKKKRKVSVESIAKKKKRKRMKKEKMKKKRKLDSGSSDNDNSLTVTEHKHKRRKKNSGRKHSRSNERRTVKKRRKRTKQ